MFPEKTPCFEAPKAIPTQNREDIWRSGSVGKPTLPVNVATPRNKKKPVVIATGLFKTEYWDPISPSLVVYFDGTSKSPRAY